MSLGFPSAIGELVVRYIVYFLLNMFFVWVS